MISPAFTLPPVPGLPSPGGSSCVLDVAQAGHAPDAAAWGSFRMGSQSAYAGDDELTPRSMAGTTTVGLRFTKAAKKSLRDKRGVKLAIAVRIGSPDESLKVTLER